MKSVGVVRFPGTNCDRDIWLAVESAGFKPVWLWHKDRFDSSDVSAVVIPGGFSYGDYLRSGALAAKAPAMMDVKEFAQKGRPVLGICNGFQILCESGLLPGALVKNQHGRFVDKWSTLNVVSSSDAVQTPKNEISLPIAHGDGRFHHDQPEELFGKGQVWLTYADNPNGSVRDIAGVKSGNTHGLMPHPERALFDWMGGTDGMSFFKGLVQ